MSLACVGVSDGRLSRCLIPVNRTRGGLFPSQLHFYITVVRELGFIWLRLTRLRQINDYIRSTSKSVRVTSTPFLVYFKQLNAF